MFFKRLLFWIIPFALAGIFLGCNIDRNKMFYVETVEVCDKTLFVEVYKIIGGGAYGGDRVSNYLTDSLTFRIYAGTFITGNAFNTYECDGDSVRILKGVVEFGKNRIVDSESYKISDLKEKKIFE